ncbi:hypothetical protein MTO96_037004 [Rhipicephalus appendiculatus]
MSKVVAQVSKKAHRAARAQSHIRSPVQRQERRGHRGHAARALPASQVKRGLASSRGASPRRRRRSFGNQTSSSGDKVALLGTQVLHLIYHNEQIILSTSGRGSCHHSGPVPIECARPALSNRPESGIAWPRRITRRLGVAWRKFRGADTPWVWSVVGLHV